MPNPSIAAIAPVFIVHDVTIALSFYIEKLGFEVTYREPEQDPFFAIVQRDAAMIFLKAVGIDPLPNNKRHTWVAWDAYLYVPAPDVLAAEFASRDVAFLKPLQDTNDGLRGFELADADGYVLFFGRPKN